MTSFVGSRVSVKLAQGGADVRGTIVAVDGTQGSLTIVEEYGGYQRILARNEIADLSILPASYSSAAGATAVATSSSGAGGSSGQSSRAPPSAPAAMMQKSGSGAHGTKKKTNNNKQRTQKADESDLEEDFDFDKALKSFDKKKIWEEIKTADRSDPNMLLVSHNRRSATATPELSKNGVTRGHAQQEKLAWNEPVLSPNEVEVDVDVKDDRGNENEKAEILEALLGVTMKRGDEAGTWKVTMYEKMDRKTAGSLTITLRFIGTENKLRYLGPDLRSSDQAVVERLPQQYHNEMGLKLETASLFMRRLKDSIAL